jgi:hypothetical protein
MQRCDTKATLPPRLNKIERRDVTRFRSPRSAHVLAAVPELKSKSTARPRKTVENSFNFAVAKKDQKRARRYDLKSKSTSTIDQRRNVQQRNKQQQAGLPRGSFRALDNESRRGTVLRK